MKNNPNNHTDFPPLPSSTQPPNRSTTNPTPLPRYAQAASRCTTARRSKIQHTLRTWKRTHPTLHCILQFAHTRYTQDTSTATDRILETAIDDTTALISRSCSEAAVTRALVATVVVEMLNTIERLNFELLLQYDDDVDVLVGYQQRHGGFAPGYEQCLVVARRRVKELEHVHAFVDLYRKLYRDS